MAGLLILQYCIGMAGIANIAFSIARVLQYFLKISIGIGIGNTIITIGSSFLLIPIVNTSI